MARSSPTAWVNRVVFGSVKRLSPERIPTYKQRSHKDRYSANVQSCTLIFVQGDAFKYIVYKIAASLFRTKCAKVENSMRQLPFEMSQMHRLFQQIALPCRLVELLCSGQGYIRRLITLTAFGWQLWWVQSIRNNWFGHYKRVPVLSDWLEESPLPLLTYDWCIEHQPSTSI